jgi:hypothetical protein
MNTLYEIVSEKQQEVDNSVVGSLNEITKFQESWVQIFRKLDLVLFKTDGYKLDTGVYKVYNLKPIVDTGDVFESMYQNYVASLASTLDEFKKLCDTKKIISSSTLLADGTSFQPVTSLFYSTEQSRRFYFVMSTVFTNDDKYNEFVSRLLTDKVKGNSDLVTFIQKTCDDLKITFTREYEAEQKLFTDFEKSEEYKKISSYKVNEFNTKLNYTTEKNNETKDKEKLLKQTYSDLNINNSRKTFNGKITFN